MEFVYVVQRSDLFRDCYPQGLVPFGGELPLADFEATVAKHGFFVQRSAAETNPAWKQVIPYTVVVRGGDVFLLRRLAKGGEARLANKLSIGVGGHVNPQDATPAIDAQGVVVHSPLENGSRRELEEELEIRGRTQLARVGVINDDSNPVGAVHLGLVQLLLVEGEVRVREHDVLEGRFASPTELLEASRQGANFETWSKILVERLPDLLTARSTPPSARPGTHLAQAAAVPVERTP